ncbi:MAG: hypothetical protein ACI9VS_001968 [Candidatus Binatia bacterium]|jgi:hypothetical protein
MAGFLTRLFKGKSQRNLTEQFYRTLRVKLELISKAQWEKNDNIVRLLEELELEAESGWTTPAPQIWVKLYEIEQHLIHYFDVVVLDTELSRRIFEADALLRPEISQHYRTAMATLQDSSDMNPEEAVARKRALYFRLLNDINWVYTSREESREYIRLIRTRIASMFILCLMAFVAMLAIETSENLKATASVELQLILLAGAAGLWGASFSALTGLKGQLQKASMADLMALPHAANLLMRPVIGLGAAIVLLFMMEAGVLTGNSFPDFQHILHPEGAPATPSAEATGNSDQKNFALLVVWCFMAGFSEKLVPNLLEKQESKLSADAKK